MVAINIMLEAKGMNDILKFTTTAKHIILAKFPIFTNIIRLGKIIQKQVILIKREIRAHILLPKRLIYLIGLSYCS